MATVTTKMVSREIISDNNEQWSDIDNDGYGDNEGFMGDKFIDDPTQWNDTDAMVMIIR